jgi:hypothetical protein
LRQETRPAALFSRPGAALLYVFAVLVLGAAAARALVRAHTDRMSLTTGRAEWIWYTSRLPEPRPIRFYATQGFVLPEKPRRALAKVFVDRGHVLYVNGGRAGGGEQRPGDPLALYEIGPLLNEGENRVTIEATSPSGIGGVLFSLDVAGFGRDAFVSGGDWRVDPSPDAIASGGRYRPAVWGSPPRYPWGYPRMPRPEEISKPGGAGS